MAGANNLTRLAQAPLSEHLQGFGYLFYMVSPRDTSFERFEDMPHPDWITKVLVQEPNALSQTSFFFFFPGRAVLPVPDRDGAGGPEVAGQGRDPAQRRPHLHRHRAHDEHEGVRAFP